jgi:hypothetical protein
LDVVTFASLNPGTLADMELDTEGRFYRVYLGFGFLASDHDFGVPVLGTDGTFFRAKDYRGVILNLV